MNLRQKRNKQSSPGSDAGSKGIASYYLWKWAGAGPSCPPGVVLSCLLEGKSPPAIEPFHTTELLKLLERGAGAGQAHGEQWEWRVIPSGTSGHALAVFLSGALPEGLSAHEVCMAQALWPHLLEQNMSIFPETDSEWMGPQAKHNHFKTGQGVNEYDVTAKSIRALLLGLRRSQLNPYAVLDNRQGDFVQCYLDKKRQYVLEWRQHRKPLCDNSRKSYYRHWRLMDQVRLAALPVELRNTKIELPADQEPDFVGFPLVIEAFQAFLRNEPPPRLENWRLINNEI